MKVLYILNDGRNALAERMALMQAENNVVNVIDLSMNTISYESVIDDIFSHDRVISWQSDGRD
ncbi:MAG: hypothetical protein ABSB95_13530 [Dissulfurispiraceae bacterium]|jgi:hypothetical protein